MAKEVDFGSRGDWYSRHILQSRETDRTASSDGKREDEGKNATLWCKVSIPPPPPFPFHHALIQQLLPGNHCQPIAISSWSRTCITIVRLFFFFFLNHRSRSRECASVALVCFLLTAIYFGWLYVQLWIWECIYLGRAVFASRTLKLLIYYNILSMHPLKWRNVFRVEGLYRPAVVLTTFTLYCGFNEGLTANL